MLLLFINFDKLKKYKKNIVYNIFKQFQSILMSKRDYYREIH